MGIPIRRLILVLLFLSAISFIPSMPPFVRIICGFLQAFYLPGFAFLLFLWDRESPSLDEFFIPLAISPIVLSLLVAAMFMLTRSLGASVSLSVLILYGLLLTGLVRGKIFQTSGTEDGLPRAVVLIALLLCGMVGIFYLLNPYLLARSDTFVHAPMVGEIIDHGIPPAEPRLPNAPIRYPWLYHLFAASFVKLTGLSIFRALGLFNVMNALVFPYLIARITAHFTRKRIHISLTPIYAIAGLASASWILWPVGLLRALEGEVRGREEIARILSEIDLNSYRVIYFLTPHWMLMTNAIDKLMTITPFTYAINLFLLSFLLVLSRDFQKKAPFKAALTIAFFIAGTFLIHVVTGIVLIIAAAGGGMFMLVERLLRRREVLPNFHTLVIPALALLAGIIGLPYFRSLTGGGGERILFGNYLHFGFRNLITILAPFVGLAFIIKPLLKYLLHGEGLELKVLSTWLISLFGINLLIKLPGENEAKFISLFFMLLVIPVSIVFIDWIASARGFRRIGGLVWISILFLVPTLLTARGFLLNKPESDALRTAYMPGNERMRLYDWIQTDTADNSVIIELNTQNYTPLYAHRHTFIPFGELDMVLGYTGDEIDRYKRIHREIFSSKPLPEASIEYLRTLGCDFYILIWTVDLQSYPYLDERIRSLKSEFKNMYENPSGKIYYLNRATAR
jgi:hypothetical protein